MALVGVPSIILYSAVRSRTALNRAWSAVFFVASVLPFSAFLAWGSVFAQEGREMCRALLGFYLIPNLYALTVIALLDRRDGLSRNC